ncbi:MAG: hypothetical protein MUF45_18360 [Spirosomaceae bacterium]|jgi:hypothetical protein|nr:hypothetical protein [Spirosomataceae bacterium]
MQQEDFYRKIQEKINHLETNSEWNKDDVWRRINRQEAVVVAAPKRNLWTFAAAASIVVALGFGLIVMEQTDKGQVVSENTVNNNTVKSIASSEVIENQYSKENVIQSKALVVDNRGITPNENLTTSTVENNTNEPIIQVNPKDNVENSNIENSVTAVVQNTETPTEESRNVVAETRNEEQPATEVQFQGGKVVVLNIPVAEEEDRGKKKKNVLTKIFKKDGNKPERSDKIWAFVKESFKNDSIEKKDSVR